MVLKTTCRVLCAGVQAVCRGAGSLSDVGNYLPGTVLQECRLFKWCQNIPMRHFIAGVQAVLVVLKPTCRAWC